MAKHLKQINKILMDDKDRALSVKTEYVDGKVEANSGTEVSVMDRN